MEIFERHTSGWTCGWFWLCTGEYFLTMCIDTEIRYRLWYMSWWCWYSIFMLYIVYSYSFSKKTRKNSTKTTRPKYLNSTAQKTKSLSHFTYPSHLMKPQNKHHIWKNLSLQTPVKKEIFLTQLTFGWYLLTYFDPKFTPTEYLITIRLLFNSTISTPDHHF